MPKTSGCEGRSNTKKTEGLSSCGRAKERDKTLIIAELRQRYPLKELRFSFINIYTTIRENQQVSLSKFNSCSSFSITYTDLLFRGSV